MLKQTLQWDKMGYGLVGLSKYGQKKLDISDGWLRWPHT